MSLTPSERQTVQDAIDLLSRLLPAADAAPLPPVAPSLSDVPVGSPKWFQEYERSWKFLNAVAEAGGSLLPKELSVIATENGYDPRSINGYYRGKGCLTRAGDLRELTDVGREFIEQWSHVFGDNAASLQ